MRNIALISAALAVTLALPAATAAQAEEIVRHRAVKATAEDFATPEGLARLEKDLRSAARAVCDDHRPLAGPPSDAEERCYRRALLNARARLAEMREELGARRGG